MPSMHRAQVVIESIAPLQCAPVKRQLPITPGKKKRPGNPGRSDRTATAMGYGVVFKVKA
ncbi:hypothetical protein GLA29479_31 [Lysobacter antibioticus]|nr:hypothetical protein GLA29479_31 [Lysobacter antibioticus]